MTVEPLECLTPAEDNLVKRVRVLEPGEHLAVISVDKNGLVTITFMAVGKREQLRPKVVGDVIRPS